MEKNKYLKMQAVVIGTTCDGEPFKETNLFKLIPPTERSYYGTGYYMVVERSLSDTAYCDVRYEGTTDIEILADRFISSWYGSNAKEVFKTFLDL